MKLYRRKSWISIAIGLVSFCVLLLFGESWNERRQAANLIGALSQVEVGKTTTAQVRLITRRFSHHRVHAADEADLEDQFEYRNIALSILHLVPRTHVWVTIQYDKGTVIKKTVLYLEEPRCGGIVAETLAAAVDDRTARLSGSNARHIYVGGNAPSPTFIMRVDDTTDVPANRRALDWQIDLSCMTRIGGCRDPRKVLRGALLEPAD